MIGVVAHAATKDNELPPQGDPVVLKKMFGELVNKKPQCELELSRDFFLTILQNYADAIEKGESGKGQSLISLNYLSFRDYIGTWVKTYKYLELDSNISKKWFIKIYRYFDVMYKSFIAMDAAERSGKKAEFAKAQKAYNDAIDAFLKELKKPEKPEKRIVEQLHVQKIKEHRQYQEYLRKLKKEEE